MSENLPLSVCVITLNEEDNIERCLNSVQWADELLVVDSGSEDRTVELAEACGARTMYNEWQGHRQQKQYATDQAKHNWILSLDADEWLDEKLQSAIKEKFSEGAPPANNCFQVNRLSRYLGSWLHHGSWHPDWITRLFHKDTANFRGKNPHPFVSSTEPKKKLPGILYHIPYDNFSDHLNKMNTYTSTMAAEKHSNGETGSPLKAITHGAFLIFRDLFLKLGILDGIQGFVCALNGGIYTYIKYLKLWEKQKIDSLPPDNTIETEPGSEK